MIKIKEYWAYILIAFIFLVCAAIVIVDEIADKQPNKGLLQLLTLAGVIVGVIDNQLKQKETNNKINDATNKISENTEITVAANEEAKMAVTEAKRAVIQNLQITSKQIDEAKKELKGEIKKVID